MARRRARALVIVEHFVPDPARCAAALVKLLFWEPPADTPSPPQGPARGDAPREEPADQESPP
jgi:hypothetical protein